jgi:SNF2 family DNA or RNA helicase
MRNEATAMLEEGGYGATPEADSDSDTDSEDEAEEDNGDETLGGFIVPDEDEDALDDAEEGDDDSLEDLFAPGSSAPGPSTQAKKSKAKAKDSKGKAKKFKKTVTLAQLKKDSLRSASAKRKYLRRLRKGWETSAKISKTMELLSDIRDADPTEKTLVFSQFTAFLGKCLLKLLHITTHCLADLLEVPLTQRKFKYQRYDGSMRMDDRAEAVNQFMDDAQANIMLVSLKAGNAGLNLSKASQVIILDPFWNPFVEEQAVDRAHRMPQKREVHVHRVLVPETVEDRICALQDKKRDLINTALDEGVSKSLTRLSVGELKYLFGLGERN